MAQCRSLRTSGIVSAPVPAGCRRCIRWPFGAGTSRLTEYHGQAVAVAVAFQLITAGAAVASGHRIRRQVSRQEHRTVDSLTIGMDRVDGAGGVHAGNPSPAPARLIVTATVNTPPCPDCQRRIRSQSPPLNAAAAARSVGGNVKCSACSGSAHEPVSIRLLPQRAVSETLRRWRRPILPEKVQSRGLRPGRQELGRCCRRRICGR